MKRLITLLLVFGLLLSFYSISYADNSSSIDFSALISTEQSDFSLRNGIQFGDSEKTVKDKEDLSLTRTRIVDEKTGDVVIWSEYGKISGSDGSVGFLFDNKDHLIEMKYLFEQTKSEDTNNSRYDAIYDGLVRKYGEPLPSIAGKAFNITTGIVDDANLFVLIYKTIGIADLNRYNEWIVSVNDEYYVKIDLESDYYGKSYSDLTYELRVGYKAFTIDDYYEVIGEKHAKQEAIDRDL